MEKLKESVVSIKSKMDVMEKTLCVHKKEINDLVAELKTAVIAEMDKILSQISSVFEQIEHFTTRMDFLERDKVAADILVSGVPVLNDISAREIMSKICQAIGYEDNNTIQSAFRPNSKSKGKNSRSIIVRFVNAMCKSQFFSKYKTFKSLMLKDIGLDLETRIYCNDLLTKDNSTIFGSARELQRFKCINKTFTKRGQVFIINNNNQTVIVRNISDLIVYKKKNSNNHSVDNNNLMNNNNNNNNNRIDDIIEDSTSVLSENSTMNLNKNKSDESLITPIASRIRSKAVTNTINI